MSMQYNLEKQVRKLKEQANSLLINILYKIIICVCVYTPYISIYSLYIYIDNLFILLCLYYHI